MSVSPIGVTTSGNTTGTAINNSGVAHTKGSWTQLSASTPIPATGVLVWIFQGGNESNTFFDLGIGPSGAEVALVSNWQVQSNNGTANRSFYFYLPIAIPMGSRVTIRYQSGSGGASVVAAAYLLNDAGSLSRVVSSATYGADTATTLGISPDPGGVANTKGSYVEFTAATTENIDYVSLHCFCPNGASNFNTLWAVDVAIGAAGAEKILIGDVLFQRHNSGTMTTVPIASYFPVEIPRGSRISLRSQSNDTNATNRTMYIILIGYRGGRVSRLNVRKLNS